MFIFLNYVLTILESQTDLKKWNIDNTLTLIRVQYLY